MYSAYSLRYITLGLETIFLAFSRFGVTVPGDGAEVCKRSCTTASMKEALRLIKNEGCSLYKVSKWSNLLWITLKD
jgi:hypothetical protein